MHDMHACLYPHMHPGIHAHIPACTPMFGLETNRYHFVCCLLACRLISQDTGCPANRVVVGDVERRPAEVPYELPRQLRVWGLEFAEFRVEKA